MFTKTTRTHRKSKPTTARAAAAATASTFEPLEGRQLFSALTINGTGGDDLIRLNQQGNFLSVYLNNNPRALYIAGRYDGVVVNGLAGADRVQATSWFNLPVTFNGGVGNDAMTGGRQHDTFNGQDGDDVMYPSLSGDEFNGGLGTDTADYSTCAGGVTVTLDDLANDGRSGEGDNVRSDVENVTGGNGNDTLTGSNANNYLQGGGGRDLLNGLGGDDVLDGGVGGAYPVSRNNGNDELHGGDGNDVLHASDWGDNTIYGDAGDDEIHGYQGDDSLYGGTGRDNITGWTGDDVIYGNSGDDYIDAGAGQDKVYGNSGPLTIRDIITLPVFPINTLGATSALTVDPRAPLTPTSPIFDPGPIITPLPIDPLPIINPVPNPVLPPIDLTPRERLVDPVLIDPVIHFPTFTIVETDNDTIHGGDNNDRVRGDGGDDTVYGDNGDDYVYGDAGGDIVCGGAGEDHVYGGAGDDNLFGGDGNDVLVSIGGGQADHNWGENGFDSIWLDSEGTETVQDSNIFEALSGNYHRVGGFQQLRTSNVDTNATIATSTPSRELNGQNLLDPVAKGGTYQNFSDRPLFGSGGPSKDDIDQNGLADCYFLAGLSAVAKQNANRIKQTVVDLGDGTYAVQFFNGSTPQFWRVDADLPANGAGNPWGAGLGHGDALWGAILEKAWAFARSNRGTYASTEWGGIDTFTALNLTNSGIGRANAIDALQNIKARLDQGDAVITWTPGSPPSDCPCVGSHMYSVERVDLTEVNILGFHIVTGGTITVRNPWATDGAGNDGVNDGYVTMTADQYFRGFAGAWGADV